MNFRSAFYCTICDFANHPHIHIHSHAFNINEATCSELAEYTINFSYLMNSIAVKLLIKLTKVLRNFMNGDEILPSIYAWNKVRKGVRKCGAAFRNDNGNGKACKQYCEFYNFNANSPVIEGY